MSALDVLKKRLFGTFLFLASVRASSFTFAYFPPAFQTASILTGTFGAIYGVVVVFSSINFKPPSTDDDDGF